MVEEDKLGDWRSEIDAIDRDIMKLFVKRFDVTKKIRIYKKTNKLPVMAKDREQQIIREKIGSSGLPRKFVQDLYKIIFEESRRLQR